MPTESTIDSLTSSPKKKGKKKEPPKKIGTLFGVPPDVRSYAKADSGKLVSSDVMVGVEIELENVPMELQGTTIGHGFFLVKHDGSLRNGGAEFVTSQPLSGKDLMIALEDAGNLFAEIKPVVNDRCSVHVHLDVRDMTQAQFTSLAATLITFERPLYNFAGLHRAENNYCIPYFKALGSMKYMSGCSEGDFSRNIRQGGCKYAGTNFIPVKTQGSLEFRQMEGTYDINRIRDWINIIMSMKLEAMKEKNIEDMPGALSMAGPRQYLHSVFGAELAEKLDYPDLTRDLFKGVRLAQRLTYAQDMKKGNKTLWEAIWEMDNAASLAAKYREKHGLGKQKSLEERSSIKKTAQVSSGLHGGDVVADFESLVGEINVNWGDEDDEQDHLEPEF